MRGQRAWTAVLVCIAGIVVAGLIVRGLLNVVEGITRHLAF